MLHIDFHRDHAQNLSVSRRFANNFQPNSSENHKQSSEELNRGKTPFKLKKSTTEMAIAVTPTVWYNILYIYSQNETEPNLPARMKTVFLLHTGTSLRLPSLVIELPTNKMITRIFNVYVIMIDMIYQKP